MECPFTSQKRIEFHGLLCQSIKFWYHPTSKTIFSRKSSHTNLSCLFPTGCSTLRLHLYLKNIIENPLCNCGETEDPFHFFFECNQYNLIRRDMLACISAICNPNLNILLHGNDGLSEEQNLNIFMAVHNFIIKSKRFSLAWLTYILITSFFCRLVLS